jgi:hypothetical protein
MGWEERKGHSYYYRKERDGARVRSVYVGSGETARLIAQLDLIQSNEQKGLSHLARIEREGWQAQEAELDALAEMMDELATGMLLVAGCHTHKRQWRLKRHG